MRHSILQRLHAPRKGDAPGGHGRVLRLVSPDATLKQANAMAYTLCLPVRAVDRIKSRDELSLQSAHKSAHFARYFAPEISPAGNVFRPTHLRTVNS